MNTTLDRARPVASTFGVAVAATVAATVAVAATAHADTSFQTPSQNIACRLGANTDGKSFVVCEIADHTWAAPPRSPDCHLNWGSRFRLEQNGPARFDCYGQPLSYPEQPAEFLDYGHTLVAGTITCDSEQTGLTCTDSSTGHYFWLSRDSYELG